jgi:hypothetical protein
MVVLQNPIILFRNVWFTGHHCNSHATRS